jgi:zinc carboxypeptidase
MNKKLVLVSALFYCSIALFGQLNILTVAENSDYQSTSRYNDVVKFITQLKDTSPYIGIDTIATSIEGYQVPLLIIGNPLPQNPEEIGDRLVIYIQANIHAGEVEGKEASQMLARELLDKPDSKLLENLVVLIAPILNIDGNEQISTKNRTNQVGPINGVGVRYNGQNLDLNRDAMKLETPEIRGVVEEILNNWDPAITVDCHTTNGSFHEEPVTFTWMMNPNGDRNLINYMRDKMMPEVHLNLQIKYNVENVFYGEFIDRMDYSKGWISYASEPRYLVNYIGLRNRLAILNENYVYADYKTRVLGCYSFLKTVISYASDNKKEIKELLEKSDMLSVHRHTQNDVIDSFAIEYTGIPTPELITIKAFETDTIPGVVGYWRYKSSDRKVTVTVPYIADYIPTRNVKIPNAYLFSINDPQIISLLKSHGVVVQELQAGMNLSVERFKIKELVGSRRLNQGHYTNNIEGEYVVEEKYFHAGTHVVFTNQKLGSLVSALLEPQSDDSMLSWNFFDRYIVPQWGSGYYPYPVYRLMVDANLEIEQ